MRRCPGAGPGPGLEREAAGVGQQVAEGDALAGPGPARRGRSGDGPRPGRPAESSAWSPRPPRTRLVACHPAEEAVSTPVGETTATPARPTGQSSSRTPPLPVAASFRSPQRARVVADSRAAASAQPRFGWTSPPNSRPHASSSAVRAASSPAAVGGRRRRRGRPRGPARPPPARARRRPAGTWRGPGPPGRSAAEVGGRLVDGQLELGEGNGRGGVLEPGAGPLDQGGRAQGAELVGGGVQQRHLGGRADQGDPVEAGAAGLAADDPVLVLREEGRDADLADAVAPVLGR